MATWRVRGFVAAVAFAALAPGFDASSWARQPAARDEPPAAAAGPSVNYTLSYERDASPPSWRVVIETTGIDPASSDVALRLHDFGEWTELADYYLTSLSATPPVAQHPDDPTLFVVQVPDGWRGGLRAEYTLHPARQGTQAQRSHGLLPVQSDTYTFGCTLNTLMSVLVAGTPLTARREVSVVPPAGWTVYSGWAGETDGAHRFAMGEHDRNGLIAMGPFSVRASSQKDGVPIEVRQFGAGPPMADHVLSWVEALAGQMARSVGAPPEPIRVFLNEAAGGGMMTDRGLVIAAAPGWTSAEIESPYTRQLVAHELYHTWLGGAIRPEGDLVWFLEGFTDYLSLWHAAKAGVVTRQWFVQRLLDLAAEAVGSSSLGKVAFADAGTRWRDGDGPNETMAYKGGHILAFTLDAELRRRGHADGISSLLADLVARERRACTLADLREWFGAHAAADLYERFIAGKEVPDVRAILVSIGCIEDRRDADLAYLGIRAEPLAPESIAQRIVELDPEGPACKAGARVGDVINGWFPARAEGVSVGADVKTPYTFGLTRMTPGVEGAFLGARRGDEEMRFDVVPLVIPGGEVRTLKPGPALDGFFAKPE